MKSRKPTRSIVFEEDTLRDLDSWIDAQDVPPNRSAVVDLAVKEFLEKRANKNVRL